MIRDSLFPGWATPAIELMARNDVRHQPFSAVPYSSRLAERSLFLSYSLLPFKLSISTFHVSVMAITPAIASHNVRHPSPSNFSVFMAPRRKS
jgi:hypothetical protein